MKNENSGHYLGESSNAPEDRGSSFSPDATGNIQLNRVCVHARAPRQ